jgi:hypothetical protein
MLSEAHLRWEKAVEELGGPSGKQTQPSAMHGLQKRAEASGCLVRSLMVYEDSIRHWAGAAGWPARI